MAVRLISEKCACGHTVNVTVAEDHDCDIECRCESCKNIIARQLLVLEED